VVIWLTPGTYSFSGHFSTTVSGNASNHAAFVSTAYGGAVLSSSASTDNGWGLWVTYGTYNDFVGMTVTGPGECAGIYGTSNSAYNTYAYNRIHDIAENSGTGCGSGSGGGGIMTGQGNPSASSYNTVVNNVIWNIGTGQSSYNTTVHGIYANSTNDTIANNVVYNAVAAGIQLYHHTSYNTIIVNNTVVSSGTWGMVLGADSGTITGLWVGNNILVDNPTGIAECCSGSYSGNTYTNNLTYGNGSAYSISEASQNGVTANPLFTNLASPASGGDFSLQAGSPAIGAGTTTHAPATDMNGTVRGNPPSIGAYE
jgi:hypothetical protein